MRKHDSIINGYRLYLYNSAFILYCRNYIHLRFGSKIHAETNTYHEISWCNTETNLKYHGVFQITHYSHSELVGKQNTIVFQKCWAILLSLSV